MSQKGAWAAAWLQCYTYFGREDPDFTKEIAGLRLAYFLASFGMFRGQGCARQCQLSDFERIADKAREYRCLRDRPPQWLSENTGKVENFLTELKDVIPPSDAKATTTLTTKIALGTTACVPGYDRYVVAALRKRQSGGSPSHTGLTRLYKLREEDFPDGCEHFSAALPPMRSLDLCLFDEGKRLK